MIKKDLKGRGTGINPPNRFESIHLEVLPEEENDHFETEFADQKVKTEYYVDHSKSVISKNDSKDVGFDYSFNPYRGCEHGCVYCYARPTHEYLGFSSGLDFETKIMVKPDAHLLLEQTFRKKSYKPDVIIFSGNTDCYQPVEKKLKITRKALSVCSSFGNPVSLITKNAMILRDLDILKEMAERNLVSITISVTTLNRELQRRMEPRTSSPEKRLATVETLAENNIPVGVNLAPVIPGLTDEEIPQILKASAEAGAESAGYIILRLPFSNKELFIDWVDKFYPLRKDKILNKLREMNNGQLYNSEWGTRFTGVGVYAENIKNIFNLSCKKYKLNERHYNLDTTSFRRNNDAPQMELF